MTTTPVPPRSVDLAARVATLLSDQFPEHIPGERDGWVIGSQDVQEPRRMFVAWDLADGREHETEERKTMRLEIANALGRDGYAVTLPADFFAVFFADRPHDCAGPRYTVADSGMPSVLAGRWLVLDTWTRVHTTARRSESAAQDEAGRMNRAQALADARTSCLPSLVPFLEHADELLGDGYWWLRQEVHGVTDYRAPVRRERLDALVDIANVLRRGDQMERSGRRLAYPWEGITVAWAPQAEQPAVGYFPHPDWTRDPAEDEAIAVLVAGGLTPARFGVSVGPGAFMVESNGFKVASVDARSAGQPGLVVTVVGRSAVEQHKRVPEVLRAAGWRVDEDDPRAWPGDWVVYPPQDGGAGR